MKVQHVIYTFTLEHPLEKPPARIAAQLLRFSNRILRHGILNQILKAISGTRVGESSLAEQNFKDISASETSRAMKILKNFSVNVLILKGSWSEYLKDIFFLFPLSS